MAAPPGVAHAPPLVGGICPGGPGVEPGGVAGIGLRGTNHRPILSRRHRRCTLCAASADTTFRRASSVPEWRELPVSGLALGPCRAALQPFRPSEALVTGSHRGPPFRTCSVRIADTREPPQHHHFSGLLSPGAPFARCPQVRSFPCPLGGSSRWREVTFSRSAFVRGTYVTPRPSIRVPATGAPKVSRGRGSPGTPTPPGPARGVRRGR